MVNQLWCIDFPTPVIPLIIPLRVPAFLYLLCYSKMDAQFKQDDPKADWSIPYVSVAFFHSLNQNFIACCSSKVSSRPDCIFEIHQLWPSDFSRVYSNCCCRCSFKPEIIKIGQSFHKMYSNNILNFQGSTTILNACTKKSGTTYLWDFEIKRLSDPEPKTRPSNNYQKSRTNRIVNFVIPADHRIKSNAKEKRDKYLDLAKEF